MASTLYICASDDDDHPDLRHGVPARSWATTWPSGPDPEQLLTISPDGKAALRRQRGRQHGDGMLDTQSRESPGLGDPGRRRARGHGGEPRRQVGRGHQRDHEHGPLHQHTRPRRSPTTCWSTSARATREWTDDDKPRSGSAPRSAARSSRDRQRDAQDGHPPPSQFEIPGVPKQAIRPGRDHGSPTTASSASWPWGPANRVAVIDAQTYDRQGLSARRPARLAARLLARREPDLLDQRRQQRHLGDRHGRKRGHQVGAGRQLPLGGGGQGVGGGFAPRPHQGLTAPGPRKLRDARDQVPCRGLGRSPNLPNRSQGVRPCTRA